MSLSALISGAEPIPGGPSAPLGTGFCLTVPEDWHQGRTAYGGLSASLALAAAQQLGGQGLAPLRSAAISFVGPVFGEVEVRARLLRSGKNATWIACEVLREGETGLTATLVFMGPVASALHHNERALPEGVIPLDLASARTNPLAPSFLKNHFDIRFALPRSDPPRAEICLWVRPRDHAALNPTLSLLLSADALPPGVFPLLAAPVPTSSMIWQANLLSPAPATQDGWWLLRSRGDYAQGGCSSQSMEAWNASGEPVMSGMQSVALFG